jgi:Pro-kumamolisin, activation domain/Bacterial Ig-like domain (group 3)
MMAQEGSPPVATTARPLITESIDESQLTTLNGNTHPLARAEFDLGTAQASLPMDRMLLVLKRSPEQEAALDKLLDDQQDKASPSYHKWLDPEEFGRQFGPRDTDLQTITAWLQSHGFVVASTKGRTVLEFSGSASQVNEAFHTSIHKYIVNGEQHWANATDPQIPRALAPAIAGIDSLHNFRKKAMNHYAGNYSEKTKRLTAANPDYSYRCRGSECYGIVPYDFATIYDVLPLWGSGINGIGETIAIVGRTNINPQDASDFWRLFGLTVPANKLNIILNGVDPGINGDEGEADIDVQWSGAVAPQATIDFVTSASTESTDGIDLSAVYIVDNNLAPVMSESYGQCELGLGTAGNQFFFNLWQQASAQGISVFVSSGDNGAAGCDNPGGPAQYGLNVNGIASTPFNAAVGGTDFNQYKKGTTYWNSTNDPTTQASAKGYIPETTWNDSCTNALAVTLGYGTTAEQACNNPTMISAGGVNSTGGSGGPSNCVVNSRAVGSCSQGYAKPSWQSGAGVPRDNLRDLPDISLFASNGFMGSFYLICQRDQTANICDLNNFAGYGGTSVASPAFAGIMSLVNQKTGTPQGVPGFVLYKLATKQPNAFHDVPSGSTIAMPCYSGSPNCTVSISGDAYGVLSGYSTGTGYDLATGLGSVDAAHLVDDWSNVTFTATSATLQLNSGSPVTITHGTAVPVNIGVTPTTAGGVASLLIGTGSATTTGQTFGVFTLNNGVTPAGASTSLLPAGSYSVISHYAGDGTYGGSYSNPVSVTVAKEDSHPQTFLITFDSNGNIINSNTNAAVYGSPYLLRVNVANALGQLCAPVSATNATACPTGTVTLSNNASPLDAGTYALNSYGYFEDQTVQLPGGTDSVTAAYAGDTSFNASKITSTISISPAPTTMPPPTGSTATILAGSSTFFNATVQSSSSGVAPTGNVTLYANGTALPVPASYSGTAGSPAQGASLTAFFQPTFTTSGTKTITASYSGDSNYAPISSPATSVSVLYPTTETLKSSAQVVSSGTTITLTALVDTTQKNLSPTGTFTFYSTNGVLNATPTITQVTDSSGYSALQATLTVAITSTIDFSFNYSGDTNYAGAQSNDVQIGVPDFSIFPASTTVTLTAGQAQQLGFNINALFGFTGTVGNFTCSGLPAEATCSFSPTQLTNSGTTMLTITTAAIGQARQRVSSEPPKRLWLVEGAVLIGVCLMGISKRRHEAGIVFLICVLMLLPSCGGGGGGGGTPNPTPSITSLSPSQIAAGSTSVPTLLVNGSGFIATSAVTYGGIQHPSFINSSNQIGLELLVSDVATLGKLPVVVTNPSPGGGASNSMDFNVTTGTSTGSFTITVTATSGSVSHIATFYLTVQ